LLASGRTIDVQRLTKAVPAVFLSDNSIKRADIRAAVTDAFGGVRVIQDTATATTNILGDYVMGDKIRITNQGQIVGNIGGRGGRVRVGQQQQAKLGSKADQLLRSHLNAPEVQQALALPVSQEEKAQIAGNRLAKLAKVSIDVSVAFVSKFLAEMAKQ